MKCLCLQYTCRTFTRRQEGLYQKKRYDTCPLCKQLWVYIHSTMNMFCNCHIHHLEILIWKGSRNWLVFCGVLFRMSTHSAAVRKWPHVDCCIATVVNLHGDCSEEVALCWFIMFHTLKTNSLNTLNLVQFHLLL